MESPDASSLAVQSPIILSANNRSKPEHDLQLSSSSADDASVCEPQSPSPPSDGGLIAWLNCLGSFFLFFNSWGLINSFGAFQEFYQTSYIPSTSPSDIAWIGSLQAFLLVAGCPLTGPLFDMGFARALIVVGTICGVLGMMFASLASQYWQLLLAQGLLTGLGHACIFIPSVAILPAYFRRRRMLALGLSNAGSSLGGIVYASMFRAIQRRTGFGWAVRAIAFVMLGTQGVAVAFMKKKTPTLPPGVGVSPPQRRRMWDMSAVREPQFLTYGIAMLFCFGGLYVPFFFVQPYAQAFGIAGGDLNFYLLALLNAASFFGRILPNVIGDQTGPANAMIPCVAVTAILSFSWIAIRSMGGIIAFCILYGFFSGAYVSLNSGVVASLSPNLSVLGTRMGMLAIPMAIGLLIGTPIAGALEQVSWTGLQVFCGAFVGISFIFLVVTRVLKAGWQLRQKV